MSRSWFVPTFLTVLFFYGAWVRTEEITIAKPLALVPLSESERQQFQELRRDPSILANATFPVRDTKVLIVWHNELRDKRPSEDGWVFVQQGETIGKMLVSELEKRVKAQGPP